MKIISVVGARPNFMKIAPFIHAIDEHNKKSANPVEHILVHTGQHYDDRMSRAFFDALGIPDADINLGVGSGSHAEQVGQTMIAFEKVLRTEKPDWVVVVGDINATLACSVTAKKEHIKCCHIEAGLRSGDETMPEEINRLITDRMSDLLLTPDQLSVDNLLKEGIPFEKISFVGNIMIDTLEANRKNAGKLRIQDIYNDNRLLDAEDYPVHIGEDESYALLTMHRPSNVDRPEILAPLIDFLISDVAANMKLIWPLHPRAEKQLKAFKLWERVIACRNLVLLKPIGYHEMLRLNTDARIMLTDSGGLQQECAVLGTPCLTLRWNTEWPVTLREHGGAGVLVGNNVERIRKEYTDTILQNRKPLRPSLWDGKVAGRCLKAILEYSV